MALHSCANCAHYRPRAEVRCDVPGTPLVLDAAASNTCGSFDFHDRAPAAEASAESAGFDEDTRRTWDQLFG